uniref:SAC domain-containing protein n=1 Tax=Mesocestoides corti TaxID=53468 RepID=A0A5K3FN72_MESCO
MVYVPGAESGLSKEDTAGVGNKKSLVANASEELRLLKLFQSIELNRNFYFSYTYDLTNSLQTNMEPFLTIHGGATAFRLVINQRFLWNAPLMPPRFQPKSSGISDWFVGLIHGFAKQTSLVSCGMPVSILLLARRSRFFAGTRFLKRGVNIDGNVANEVETEQIVCDTTEPTLSRMHVSSLVQHRGSVPLFWTQDTTRIVVGKPPLAITWEDPYYEAFGKHFADLIERHGAPVLVLNLMKQREKRPFEQLLTDGFLRGINYLNQFAPQLYPSVLTPENADEGIPPIVHLGFDMARVQRSRNTAALDSLRPIAEACLQRTGIFFSAGYPPASREALIVRTRLNMGSSLCPRQHGVVRTNCVDCLDRTNTAQFVIGHVAMSYQLRAMGLLPLPVLSFTSTISKLLRDLYDEHGDTLALQYGGSCVVHNIETYQKPRGSRAKSRNIIQTLSRYYSNNFVDFEKQLATDLFLRIFRPGAGPVLPINSWQGNLEAIAASVSCRSGQAFLLSSDSSIEAHMHWLHAWFNLPGCRKALTNWFPRDALVARQLSLSKWGIWSSAEGKSTSDQMKVKPVQMLDLPANDPGIDWFSELYCPRDWTHFHNLTFNQLPLSSTARARLSDTVVCPLHVPLRAHSCSVNPRQLRSSHSLSNMPGKEDEDGQPSNPSAGATQTPLTMGQRSSSLSKVVFDEEQNSLDSDSQTLDSFLIVSPQSLGARLRLTSTGKQPNSTVNPKSKPDPTTHLLLHNPPAVESPLLLTKFSHVRLSELTQKNSFYSNRVNATPVAAATKEAAEGSNPRDSLISVNRKFSLCPSFSPSRLMTPSVEDIKRYKAYASIPLLSSSYVHTSPNTVLVVKPASMKVYSELRFRGNICTPRSSDILGHH